MVLDELFNVCAVVYLSKVWPELAVAGTDEARHPLRQAAGGSIAALTQRRAPACLERGPRTDQDGQAARRAARVRRARAELGCDVGSEQAQELADELHPQGDAPARAGEHRIRQRPLCQAAHRVRGSAAVSPSRRFC